MIKDIVVKLGDEVELYNGAKGFVCEIDKSVSQFTFTEQYITWFHLRDIKILNGEKVNSDSLTF